LNPNLIEKLLTKKVYNQRSNWKIAFHKLIEEFNVDADEFVNSLNSYKVGD